MSVMGWRWGVHVSSYTVVLKSITPNSKFRGSKKRPQNGRNSFVAWAIICNTFWYTYYISNFVIYSKTFWKLCRKRTSHWEKHWKKRMTTLKNIKYVTWYNLCICIPNNIICIAICDRIWEKGPLRGKIDYTVQAVKV